MTDSNFLHILVACHAWYGDVIGGSFRLASEFAQHLTKQGHRVSYFCCAPQQENPQLCEYEVIDGVNLFRYAPAQKRLSGLGRLRFHLAATGRLVRKIHEQHPVNVISGHSPLQALGAAQAIHCEFVNYTVHSPFDDELLSNVATNRPSLANRVACYLARQIDRKNVQRAHRGQTDSHYTRDVFQKKHGRAMANKGIVSPGWVDTNAFQPAESRFELRQKLGSDWQTDSPLFFTLRRLENRMGLDTLVDACRILKSEGHKFRALIGGGGSLKEKLLQQIRDSDLDNHVRLLGRLPEESLTSAYAAADCFVLPTRALECFGLIVLEAFACNTPVIASAAAAIPELAQQQGDDWMFEPGNVEQLADRMRAFLCKTLSPSVNLREISQRYDKPRVLEQWTQLVLPPDSESAPCSAIG